MYPAKRTTATRHRFETRGKRLRTASTTTVLASLQDQIAKLDDGARLPTVRELMKSFRVSQATVQDALTHLREAGLLTSQVGRGTYVTKSGRARSVDAPASSHLDSLLILANASLNERCVLVQNYIVDEMSRSGSKVVQISYHNTNHLLDILSSIPDFDAVVLQSHYESIPIRLLNLLQEKTRALVVDGHTVSGVDIDRIGTDWEEALESALAHLSRLGHESIALVSIDSTAQPILSVRRAFERIARRDTAQRHHIGPISLRGVLHPTQSVGQALRVALTEQLDAQGRLPFTAMITLGISDALGVRRCVEEMGISCPEQLSIFLLGHHDVPTEHLNTMSMAGSSYLEGAKALVETIHRRLATPDLPPQIIYLECTEAVRGSTASPGN